jgi:ribosomal RNA-processing protein 9
VAAWAGADKKVYAHDFRSGKAAEPFVGHRAAITSLAFRCNTRQLFSGSHDRTVKVWNMDEMCYIETLYGHHSEVLGLDSLNQERALSVGSDRTLRLWKVVDETQLIFRGHEASIDCVSMTNEEIFVSGSQDGAVAVWSVRKKKPIASRPRAHGLGGCDVANSLDNWISSVAAMRFTDVFASGSCDGVVRLWQVLLTPPPVPPKDLNFSFALFLYGNALILFLQLGADNFGMNEICSVEVKGWVNSMCFSHDRRFLFCGVGREHRLGRWFTDESGALPLSSRIVLIAAFSCSPAARDGIAIVSLPPIDLQQQNSA